MMLPDEARITLAPAEAARIALAVVAQALRDAQARTPAKRNPARYWLAAGDAAELLTLCGRRIDQADINSFLARCRD